MCGKKAGILSKVKIDGTVMRVCPACSSFGRKRFLPVKPKEDLLFEEVPELVGGFARKLRSMREKRGLSQLQLADAVHEPVSVIKKAERGEQPPEKTLRKLEKYFKTELINNAADEKVRLNMDKSGRMCLGHAAMVRKR